MKSKKYECSVCRYVYDPKGDNYDPEGSPLEVMPDEVFYDHNSSPVPPIAFEDVPEDWSCPRCGGAKKDFTQVK